MQTLVNFLAAATAATSAPSAAQRLHDDRRDQWVGLVCAVGLCAFAAADVISLL